MTSEIVSRPVLVHYHIFKNGGSTIDYVLEREFHSGFSTLHGPDASSTLTKSDLSKFLQGNPQVRAVSSHHLRYPTLRRDPERVIDICMLRHPLDRLLSVYRYLRERHVVADDPLCKAAGELTAPQFFDLCLQHYPTWVRNVQVGWLAGDRDGQEAPGVALAELPEIALLGTLDQFDESLVTWEYTLAPLYPGISFHYLAQNLTQSPRSSLLQRLDRFRKLCGDGLFEELLEANSDDVKLFEAASSLVRQRYLERADAEHWLREFRERNQRLEQQCRTSLRARLRNRIFRNNFADHDYSGPGSH